mmetsp:Transcript_8671/g.25299  ORF Transcript_8671/g.25299 Transcript_8671/m.25299 type:complete len:339 (+) Transcript_8671:1147-2163(+)
MNACMNACTRSVSITLYSHTHQLPPTPREAKAPLSTHFTKQRTAHRESYKMPIAVPSRGACHAQRRGSSALILGRRRRRCRLRLVLPRGLLRRRHAEIDVLVAARCLQALQRQAMQVAMPHARAKAALAAPVVRGQDHDGAHRVRLRVVHVHLERRVDVLQHLLEENVRVLEHLLRRTQEVVDARLEPRDLRRRVPRHLQHAHQRLLRVEVVVEPDGHAQHALPAPVAARRYYHVAVALVLAVVHLDLKRLILAIPNHVDEGVVQLLEHHIAGADDEVEEVDELRGGRRRVALHAQHAEADAVGLLGRHAVAHGAAPPPARPLALCLQATPAAALHRL